ncbi:MAG TPA: M20/M25/M40 family metallo-hydrolase [Pyrinomonadaceae bacterium]|nr:M20/M25/M40 family metallo-hydrolase [Pyrinomonadaceae bacterium]
MIRRRAFAALLMFALLVPPFVRAQQPSPTPTPTPTAQTPATPTAAAPSDPVERIKEEGLKRSQVMQTIQHLTEVIGPRLTGSPALKRANEWTRDRLAGWGLQNAHLEGWQFGRGWTLERFSAEVVAPQSFPLLAYPKAWSPGTQGALTGEIVNVEARTEEELQRYKGRLKGAFVMVGSVRELKAEFERPRASRMTEKELLELADAPDPATVPPRPARQLTTEQRTAAAFAARKIQFYYEEGAALLIDSSRSGDGGMLQFVQSALVPTHLETAAGGRVRIWDKNAPQVLPQISISNDHYNRLARMIAAGERPRATVNIATRFNDEDPMSYNTVAEIPGTDLKDEVVMLGAHLDSWHTATGATDNAAGVGIMMEAVRILRALNLQPRRTVRIALWSGEEQGLFGSRAYVREHFGPVNEQTSPPASGTTGATAATSAPTFKPEYDKLSVYFNADSGTGRIRGVYLQGNEALRPIFRRWLEPFRSMGASTITVSNAGGSDFLAFDAVGLNGIDFMQDEIEYGTRTWHSNQDTFDRIQADDVKQAAIIVAAFVYHAATMDERLPRKPFRGVRPAL